MKKYVALLRGINLGSRHRLSMSDLKSLTEELGWHQPQTYLQSGNLVFTTSDEIDLGPKLQSALKDHFGYDIEVLIRTAQDMARIVVRNPFLLTNSDPKWMHVTFLKDSPTPQVALGLDLEAGGLDKWVLLGDNIYLFCPGGYGRTKLNNGFFERKLKKPATTRNWQTVLALKNLLEN
jgi:uncharacterized protein (DUF1697 family)